MLKRLGDKLQGWFGDGRQREQPPVPGAADVSWLERGLTLQRAGRSEEALASFGHAVAARHDDIEALVGQAQTHNELGHLEDAADCYELALAFSPDHLPALLGLARLRREAEDCDGARDLLERGAQVAPRSAEPYFELGLTHNRGGNTRAALSGYGRALELAPDHVAACINTGLIHLAQLGDPGGAQRYFERAAALQPESVAAQANLGLALQEQGEFEAARVHYDRLIEAYPHVAEYRWNRGIARLSAGDYAHGWNDYEARNERPGKSVARDFPLAPWDGGALGGRHILIYGEQGIGDEVMFASCVPDILRQARGVVIECDARLGPLFQRSFPAALVHGGARDGNREWLQAFPELSVQVACGSLPRFLRRSAADFPQHRGYLLADPARVAGWKSRLPGSGGALNVGLSWHGGTRKTREELRSLPFGQCLPWLTTRDCRFVCLQRGDCAEEVAAAKQVGVDLDWWPQALQDTDELAALIAALDLVISVDNSTVHLAGALGQRCWVLLSHAPDWRYPWRGEAMPWYPSVRLFRQAHPGDWLPVVASVTAELGRSERQ